VTDSLVGGMTIVLGDSIAVLWSVAFLLGLLNAVATAALLIGDLAGGQGDGVALPGPDKTAFLLGDWLADGVPNGLAVVDGLVLALVVVLGAALLVSHLVNDEGAVEIVYVLHVKLVLRMLLDLDEASICGYPKQAEEYE